LLCFNQFNAEVIVFSAKPSSDNRHSKLLFEIFFLPSSPGGISEKIKTTASITDVSGSAIEETFLLFTAIEHLPFIGRPPDARGEDVSSNAGRPAR
jgi:hypothetical protein